MFSIYVILVLVIGFLLGIIIGDLKSQIINKIGSKTDLAFQEMLKGTTAYIEALKNTEVKNISAAENKDATEIKSDVNNITPPKV